MTEQNQITITQRNDGVYEARDGCHKWVSKNGIDWLQQDGKPPPLRALRSAMFRHWEGEVTTEAQFNFDGGVLVHEDVTMPCCGSFKAAGADDPLTPTERIALEGAIKDAKAGLAAGVSVENAERVAALDNQLPKAINGPRKGQVFVVACSVYHTFWRSSGPSTKQEAVAEVEGYTGSISEWPRGRAYQTRDGDIQIVLHPHDDTQDYFIHAGIRQKLMMRKKLNTYFPIPGSTGRLVPEIITNETNETE